ncbi:spinster family MFS transporter [Denitromonas iodatirespirans]|uniref:MFS transporter n=1 Tax=Denitromonas iodatirespirans TaxID=2795389 RepID=A0A944D9U5_DENI1|nr:MFS transporter [Denitromonas iodatirespirans]MBT0961186.1 MFS transporter [Denitromonas iodatirespirans]
MRENSLPTTTAGTLRPSLAWYLLGVLLIANVLSFVDRQILSLLVQPIRADLGISDTEISLLQGFAFTVLYSVLGLPLGRYADHRNRKWLIVCGVVIWSLMTMACGLADTYGKLFVARIGVGIGEATLAPAAYSMICDAFSARRRGTALGLYSSGIYLGIGASIAIGGFVLAALHGASEVVLPLFGAVRAWQAAFILVGAPGLLLALILTTVREPARQSGSTRPTTLAETFAYLSRHRTLFGLQLLGYALIALAAYGVGTWVPTVFIRSHGWTAAQAGINYGLFVTLLGTLGGLASGALSDRWLASGRGDARLMLTIISLALWLPLLTAGMLAGDSGNALILLGVAASLSSMANSLGPTALHDIVPGWLRGQATALFFFVINMIGLGVGPTAVALVTDHVFHDDLALRYSALVVALPAVICGGVLLLLARRRYLALRAELAGGSVMPAAPSTPPAGAGHTVQPAESH